MLKEIHCVGLYHSFKDGLHFPDALGGVKPLLTVVPSYVLFRPWTLLTAGFTESRIVFLINHYFINFNRELVKYIIVVTLCTYTATTLALYLTYAASLDLQYLFGVQANGLGGLLCGFVVAFKQAVPEHSISVFKLVHIRVKHLPSMIFIAHFILYAIGFIHVALYIETFGMIASWIYIRFYKVQDGIRGDRSETFSFASFFPDAFHSVLKPISTITYRFMVKYHLLPPLPARPVIGGMDNTPQRLPAGSDGADAERRRALALRTLDQRLQNIEAPVQQTSIQMESITPLQSDPDAATSQPKTNSSE
ncbi:hypothetical protein BATDEDRAFT_21613 [Batrachochytrium dendrobatidis JAM81]|uniref:Uncharacterized protein n=1 Tax=Batrachochytrium dendrobatidis (strain JAM81 / FGSC 10211) TaxID=684364 RepID=F4NU42_BATDJ|nr:uncharacterized protein BATDEDRAFT_21613 [Batrachochytrium dendrobatidis JAM81]EGF83980.1 hypothetical protein BATDEDRAFT_21613 [Batrachochytrium dendrobatidis JAM81]|eukprot:XP_006675332.1 hypothetical protein BATDEDRAFT_21613 [Batrachochytrium dendrobatidis JAM81]